MPPILLPRPPARPNSFIASPTSVRSPTFSFEPVNLEFQLLHPSPHDLSSSWLPRATRKTPLGSAPNCAPSSDSEEDVIIVMRHSVSFGTRVHTHIPLSLLVPTPPPFVTPGLSRNASYTGSDVFKPSPVDSKNASLFSLYSHRVPLRFHLKLRKKSPFRHHQRHRYSRHRPSPSLRPTHFAIANAIAIPDFAPPLVFALACQPSRSLSE
ncbi:hypothetical protein BJY52DRAFT_1195075 [Lactarius psammicola]|nr:hypothetical protein BJY52DRAFT_1195075 [Lactarius psammicola]